MRTRRMEFTSEFFDDASREWRTNKRHLKWSGAFVYICQYTYKWGKKCGRDTRGDYCRQHNALDRIGKLPHYHQLNS